MVTDEGPQLAPGMPARRSGHHGEGHQAYGAHRPGVEGAGAGEETRHDDGDRAKKKA
jgi:hypothetical protein